ncbi:MAG: CBS domain-containing protein [Pirellulaceae bacterium]|nr:CBS domain-containing protein [Pirellulaceae bacterium]
MNIKHAIPNAESMMNRHVHTLTPEMSLKDVVQELRKHDISCAPVVKEEKESKKTLIGFVSEGDCLAHLSSEMFFGNPWPPQTAATIMNKHPICVSPGDDLFSIASVVVSRRLRHLPVVDANDQVLGLISRREVISSLETFYDQMDQDYRSEHFRPDLHEVMNLRFVTGKE